MNGYDQQDQGWAAERRPGVVRWFKAYLIVTLVLGVVLALAGLAMVSEPATFLDTMRESGQSGPGVPTTVAEVTALGWAYGIAGLVSVVLPLAWFLWPRGGGKWVFGVVLIALGMPVLVTLPLLIPLLIFWVAEDCKAWCRGQARSADGADFREPWE